MLSCKTSRKSTEQFLRKTCHRRTSKLDRYYKISSGRAEAPKNSKLQSNTVDALNLYLNLYLKSILTYVRKGNKVNPEFSWSYFQFKGATKL